MLRTTPLTSKLCTIARLCFGSCSFFFSTVFSNVVLQKGIEKFDRRIAVCIKSCREDAYILKRMQMDCRFFGDFPVFFFGRGGEGRALSHCRQIGSHVKSGNRLLDWLHELGKLANGLAGVPSSPTRKDKFKRSCVRWSFVVFHILVPKKLTSLLGKNLAEDTADFGKDSLASRRHFGTGREDCFQISVFCGRMRSARNFEDTISWKPSPSPPMRQFASLHEDDMPKFTASCSEVVALARANFSCDHVLNLGAAHMIWSALCGVCVA